MAEEITKYTVAVGFDAALRKFNSFEKKMNNFSNKQEKSLRKQINLQKQLNNLKMKGLGGYVPPTAIPSPQKIKPKIQDSHVQRKNKNADQEAKAFKRMQSSIRHSALWMDKLDASGKEVNNSAFETAVQQAKTSSELKRIVASERARLRDNKRLERSLKKQNVFMSRMKNSSNQMAGNMVSAFALSAGVAGITKIGQDFESVANTMLAVSKDSKEAGMNLKFVREEAFRLGAGLKESTKGFAKMVAARGEMSLDDTKKLFSGVAEMSTLLGLTAEESGRATNAIQQINGLAS